MTGRGERGGERKRKGERSGGGKKQGNKRERFKVCTN